MTDRPDLDTRLSGWLIEEAASRAPARLIHATRERVDATQQIGGRRWLGWRIRSLTPRPAVMAAALLVAVVVGVVSLSLNRAPSIGTNPSSATPSSSPTPSSPRSSPSSSPFVCQSGQGTCLGALEPGAHSTTSFVPTIRYTVPAGWVNTLDIRGEMDLLYSDGGQYRYPDGLTFHDSISIFRRPVAESSTSRAPLKGIGTKAKDLANWLDTHVDLNASSPTPVTIGGARGYRMVISVPTGPRTKPDHCTSDHGEPRCESLFISDDPAAVYGFGIVGPETAVVYLLDAPSGDTVMVVIDDVDGVDQAGLVAAGTPIVNSVVFAP
ncbi:MAG TPA: hypothetical protein VIL81_10035 [Candidatus Limnocylindrales bacterium]